MPFIMGSRSAKNASQIVPRSNCATDCIGKFEECRAHELPLVAMANLA